jgi:antirestriction protein ArdC
VFKAGQVDCYPPGAPEPLGPVERIAAAVFCGSATMTRSEGYYATLVHELTHGSGAKHRLDRELGKRFADRGYAAEQLVAEIGAAFLCAELGITEETRIDHAQYLAQWLRLLEDDSRAILAAAAKASEAAS